MFSHFLDKDSKSEPDFEKRKFFAAEEEVFFKRLIKALPNCSIFPKVQVAAILEPHISNEKKRQIMRQKLQSRHVDFGIFDKNLELLCVIILEGDEAVEEPGAAVDRGGLHLVLPRRAGADPAHLLVQPCAGGARVGAGGPGRDLRHPVRP